MEYELLFFTSVANEDRIGEIKREIEDTVTGRGGKISSQFSDIGKRKLAYPIKKQTHAFFSFCHFTIDDTENIPELNRRLNMNDKIIRHIIVRADEIGKPITSQAAREQKTESKNEKVASIKEKVITEKENAEVPREKVEMKELDEKLSEILEEKQA